jgi:hypothetical protein
MNGPGIVRRRGGDRAGAPNARSRAGQTIAGRVAAFDKMHTEDLVRVVPGMRICGRELGEVNSRFGKLRVGSRLSCQYRDKDRRDAGGTRGSASRCCTTRMSASGYMKPAPGSARTIYHALPTTTTLCAKYDGKVVGTLSLIRESLFGFPLQAIFDLTRSGRGAARSPRYRRWRCTRTSARPAARSCSR